MAKVVLGVVLLLAGISLLIVSVWLLVDTKVRGVHVKRGHSPEIGVAASGVLAICGILCCCVNKANTRRLLVILGLLVATALTAACFGIAIRDRIDVEKMMKITSSEIRIKGKHYNVDILAEILDKLKTQLVVMAVIAGLDILVELSSIITACTWKEHYYP